MYIFNSTIIVLINPIYYKCKTMYIPPLLQKKKEIKKIKNNVPEQNESDYKTTAVREP